MATTRTKLKKLTDAAKPKSELNRFGRDATGELKDARQELYCQGVASGLTGGEAAVQAGYKVSSSRQQSTRLKAKQHIGDRIQQLRGEIAKSVVAEVAVDRAQVLRWLMEHRQMAILAGDLGPANKAAELIGKAVEPGMFSEKIELGGTMKVNFNIKTGGKG